MADPIITVYTYEYMHPDDKIKLLSPKPAEYMRFDTARRVLPTKFNEVYRNSISANNNKCNYQDLKKNKFVPDWKQIGKKACDNNWINPLRDRRQFIQFQAWNLKKKKLYDRQP